jgi:hypothetical protein
LLVFLAGLFSPAAFGKGAPRWFLAMFVLSVLLIGGAQAVFVHFDFRYMFPLAAFVLPYGGLGLARLEGAIGKRRALAVAAYCAVLIPPFVFSILSIVNQREVFGDIRAGSKLAAEATAPENRIFTNEYYNTDFPVVKVAFWAGRDVFEDAEMKSLRDGNAGGATVFRPGDTLVLSSIYAPSPPGGGPGFFPAYLDYLSTRYRLTQLGRFDAEFVPLLTDLMTVPGAHASPLAWIYRYQKQRASTLVLRVDEVKP